MATATRRNVLIGSTLPAAAKSIADAFEAWDIIALGRQSHQNQRPFSELDVYRRCVLIVAGTVSHIPWSIMKGETEVWRLGTPRPDALSFLGNHQRNVWLSAASTTLEGAAFHFKERVGPVVTGLRYLNPLTVKEKIDKTDGLVGFTRTVNGIASEHVYPLEDILHILAPDPYVEVGRAESTDGRVARGAARVLLAIDSFLGDHLEGGTILNTFLEINPDADEEQVKNTEKWWRRAFGRDRKSADAKAIPGKGIVPHVIGEGLKSLSDAELSEGQIRKLCAGLGVPSGMVLADDPNKSTAQEARPQFYEDVAIPRAELIAEAYNEQLLGDYGLSMELHPERMEVFQAKEFQKAETIFTLVGMPILTPNEGREKMGEDPIEEDWANKVIRPGGDEPVDAGKQLDVDRWKRKVKRKGLDADFSPDYLSDDEADAIKARLGAGMDVDRAFLPPYANF